MNISRFKYFLVVVLVAFVLLHVREYTSDLADNQRGPRSSPAAVNAQKSLWNKMNSEWDHWQGRGFCRGGRSLLSGIKDDICFRRECIFSATTNTDVEIDRMLTYDASKHDSDFVKWTGDRSQCRPASGGQTAVPSDDQPIEVSFIYSVFNKPSMTASAMLEVFRTAHETKSAEFVIVDDGSTESMDDMNRMLTNLKHFFGIKIIRLNHDKSKGYTDSVSEAIRLASATYALLLNTDVFVLPGWLKMLLRTMKANSGGRVGMVGSMMIDANGAISEAGGGLFRFGKPYNSARGYQPLDQSLMHARVVDYISAACLLVRRKLFIQLNLFNSNYSPAYYEDTDAAVVHAEHGWQTILQPFSVVIHYEGSSYGTDGSSSFKMHQMAANGKLFRETHKETLENYCPAPEDAVSIPRLMVHMGMSFYRQRGRILMLDGMVPEPDRDAGSVRSAELLRILQELGYSVTFEPQSLKRNVKYVLNLLSEGISVVMPGTLADMATAMTYDTRFSSSNVMHILKLLSEGINVVMPSSSRDSVPNAHSSESFQFNICPWDAIFICRRDVFTRQISTVKMLCPHVPIIFDTVDVHFIRELRMFNAQHSRKSNDLYSKSFENVMKSLRLELGHVLDSNITLVVSRTEKDLLNNLLGPTADVRVVSNIYRLPDEIAVNDDTSNPNLSSSISTRSGAIFVGNMCHKPNVDAVDFITRQILHSGNTLPPEFKVHMVWSRSRICPDPIQNAAEKNPWVVVHRDISDVELAELHQRVKVVLAPLRYGAGVKGKINYALQHGVPVLATSIAAEGMGLVDGKSFLLADTGEKFVRAINRIYGNESLFLALADNGREVMRSMFGYNLAKNNIKHALGDVNVVGSNGERHSCPNSFPFEWRWTMNSYFPLYPRLPFTNDFVMYKM